MGYTMHHPTAFMKVFLWTLKLSHGTFDLDIEIRTHYPTVGIFILRVNYGKPDFSGAAARCYFNLLSYMVKICQVTAVLLCFQSLHLLSLCRFADPLLKISKPSGLVFHLKSEWKLTRPSSGADTLNSISFHKDSKIKVPQKISSGYALLWGLHAGYTKTQPFCSFCFSFRGAWLFLLDWGYTIFFF